MENIKRVVTRFAPSPTGVLHIGGARTALYNYLFAKHYGGKFKLRIEDTDKTRSKDEYSDNILENLLWLGLKWDSDVIYQSDRTKIYNQYLEMLLAKDKAYYCYCDEELLQKKKEIAIAQKVPYKYDGTCRNCGIIDKSKPHIIRFKNNEEQSQIIVSDLIRGAIKFETDEIDDFILCRSSGDVTYNFAVTIDDAEMGITHIIRGDDHIVNSPKQILLYNALDFDIPQFAHLPMILGSDKKRLSKRHGALDIITYREMGILHEAIVNFIARIGWSYKDEEIFSLEELITKFSLHSVGRSAGVFNFEKLLWLNKEHLKLAPIGELEELYTDFLIQSGIRKEDIEGKNLELIINGLRNRCHTIKDMVENGKYFFEKKLFIPDDLVEKHLTSEIKTILSKLYKCLIDTEEFNVHKIETVVNKFLKEENIELKLIAQPLRILLTGQKVSPGLFELMEGMGKELVINRFSNVGIN